MDYDSCHHLPVEKKNYPPPPEGRAPSPPNKDEGKPFIVPDCHHSPSRDAWSMAEMLWRSIHEYYYCHHSDSVGNAHYIPKEVKVRSTFLNALHTVAV